LGKFLLLLILSSPIALHNFNLSSKLSMNFISHIVLFMAMLCSSFAFRGMFRKNVVGLSRASLSMNAKETATTAISANKVMVFSKSSCPFCLRTKSKLTELKIEFGLLELGEMTK
jgi:thioredoxin-related protein